MRRASPGATKRTPAAEPAAVTTAEEDCCCAAPASCADATPHRIAKEVKIDKVIRSIDMILYSLFASDFFGHAKARHTLTRKRHA